MKEDNSNWPVPETGCVLVIDGDANGASEICSTLERASIQSHLAHRPSEVHALIEQVDMNFDAVVLNHSSVGEGSFQIIGELRAWMPLCSVLVIGGYGEEKLARAYRERGAYRYICEPLSPMQLLAHIHNTIADACHWRAVAEPRAQTPVAPPVVILDMEQAVDRLVYIANLSKTEREVAYWMLHGKRDAEIARLLGRAERTAKRHVGSILSKTGVNNRASLWARLHSDSGVRLEL